MVRSGDQFPVDGVVIEGDAMVDLDAFTAESEPLEKTAGDRVFAMTLVMAGTVNVRVEATADNTNAANIVRVIEQAMEHKVGLQSSAEKFADCMVLPTLRPGGCRLHGGRHLKRYAESSTRTSVPGSAWPLPSP